MELRALEQDWLALAHSVPLDGCHAELRVKLGDADSGPSDAKSHPPQQMRKGHLHHQESSPNQPKPQPEKVSNVTFGIHKKTSCQAEAIRNRR